MVETLRYTKIGLLDVDLGDGSRETQLVDGRVILMPQIHQSSLLLTKTQELRATAGESQLIASGLLPSDTRIAGVTIRISQAFGTSNGLTAISIGWNDLADHWGAAIAVTLGTTTSLKDFTDRDQPIIGTTAMDIHINADSGTFDGTGRIEIKTWYDRLLH